jgi:hypothetical protein
MATNGTSTAADQSNDNLGKDEVAWFFVEQYYTTLSKTPEKLHLFYSKQSQFVYGKEAEVANVSVGRQKIQERIKSLDFKDNTKVRVSNVDSQTSHENIVIQVIGETAFKATEDPKKFVQTFVLAKQPSGYFVLNDILRYIDDGETEEEQLVEAPAAAPLAPETEDAVAPTTEEAAPEPVAATQPVADAAPPATASLDAGVLDQKLEEVSVEEKEATPVNGDAATEQPAEATTAAPEATEKTETAAKPDPEATSREVAEEDTKEPEKPTDPSPTPVATRQPAPAAAPVPAQPPKPMTWASRAAAAAGPRPAVPAAVPKTATPPASRPAAQAPPAPAAQPAAPAPAPAPAQASEATPANAAKESTEWQTAGSDNKRHTRPQSVSAPRAEKEGTLGYVKFTSEKVDPEELKSALSAHGELVYFDVNRQKSCAFIEFGSPAGYQAAVAANPHVVNGESIMVEPRRPKAGAYGGASYSTGRGGNMAGRGGRGGFDGGRSGAQGGRGNFGGQGRGRGGMPRGGARGASQAANA